MVSQLGTSGTQDLEYGFSVGNDPSNEPVLQSTSIDLILILQHTTTNK